MLQRVAATGSFASTARALDLDPSSVSRTISGLEAELGIRLFQRSTRRLALTEAGATYLSRIAPLLDGLEEARDAATGLGAVSGQVRLATSVAFGHEVILPLLPKFRHNLPDVALDLVLSDGRADLLAEGIDIAIRLAPEPKGDLISTRLMHTRYHVVGTDAFAAQLDKPSDLSGMACLRQSLPEFRTEWLFRQNGSEERVPVDGPFVISNPLALREAARLGLGPALLADWLVRSDLRSGRLVDLFPNAEVTATTFETGAWLLYPSRAYLPMRVRAVIDLLRENLPPGN